MGVNLRFCVVKRFQFNLYFAWRLEARRGLLAVARCARSARSGSRPRCALTDPAVRDRPPSSTQISGATARSAALPPLAPSACPTQGRHRHPVSTSPFRSFSAVIFVIFDAWPDGTTCWGPQALPRLSLSAAPLPDDAPPLCHDSMIHWHPGTFVAGSARNDGGPLSVSGHDVQSSTR